MLRNPNEYHNRSLLLALGVCPVSPSVTEVVQTLQLCTDRDELDVVGDLSVCLDGMTVDPETFATAEANHQGECLLGKLRSEHGSGTIWRLSSRLSRGPVVRQTGRNRKTPL